VERVDISSLPVPHATRQQSVAAPLLVALLLSGCVASRPASVSPEAPGRVTLRRSQSLRSVAERVVGDHQHFYSLHTLPELAGGVAIGAVMANTSIDREVHRHFQKSIQSATTDEWFHALHAQKEMGNGYYTLPVFAAAWTAGALFGDDPRVQPLGAWGGRSLRAVLVGAPPMLAAQAIIGGSRPDEAASGSAWTPLEDNNGVSGHAFMGAVPFLTAAALNDDPRLKWALYAGSALVPLSRVNDNDHYPSQAFLGWWFAWLATQAVTTTEREGTDWSLSPWLEPGTSGILFEHRF